MPLTAIRPRQEILPVAPSRGVFLPDFVSLAGPALVGEINEDLTCMLRDGCGHSLASVKSNAGFRAKGWSPPRQAARRSAAAARQVPATDRTPHEALRTKELHRRDGTRWQAVV